MVGSASNANELYRRRDQQHFNEVRVVHTSAKQNTSDHPCNPPRATYGVDTEPYEYMCVELLPGSVTWSDGLGSGNEVTIGGVDGRFWRGING